MQSKIFIKVRHVKYYIFLVFCFTIICFNNITAHEINTYQFELLWKEKGLNTILTNQQIEKKLSEKEMNAFVFRYQLSINEKVSQFWTSVREAHSNEFDVKQAELLLESYNKEIVETVDKFKNDKTVNNSEFREIMEIWETHIQNISNNLNAPLNTNSTHCDNVGFEEGDFSNWSVWLGRACLFEKSLNCNGFNSSDYTTASNANRIELISSGYDPLVGGTKLGMVYGGSGYSLRMENRANGGDATKVSYTFTVDSDNPIYSYNFALVLEEPGNDHHKDEKPYFMVQFYDNTQMEEIKCGFYKVFADDTDEEFRSDKFQYITPESIIKFTQWQTHAVDLIGRIGNQITVTFTVSDCALGGHLGYAYIDAACMADPVTIGDCLPDGTRELSVSGLFQSYKWVGPGIVNQNDGTIVVVNKEGNYFLTRKNLKDACFSRETFIVDGCENQNPSTPCSIDIQSHTIGECDENNNLFDLDLSFNLSNVPEKGVIKIQDGKTEQFLYLPQTNPVNFTLSNLYADGLIHKIKISIYKDNYMSEEAALCSLDLNIQAPEPCYIPDDIPCENCIGSFKPFHGEKYVLSAWIKEENAPATTLSYTNANIKVKFTDATDPDPPPANASGKIIDGWQRIYQEFIVPEGATLITIELATTSGTAFFDDIRIYPVNSSMKSYVYDPVSLKLVAELDENNYATFYEYDQEGTLIRTKKETEKGIVTITENRQSNPKK